MASFPVAGATGEVVALIEASQPTSASGETVGRLAGNLLLFATILGYMAYRQVWADKKH